MKKEIQFFARKRVDYDKLTAYGFTKEKEDFFYRTKLLDAQFLMEVCLRNGEIQTRLLDTENECEYILHLVDGAQGEFVGAVRAAYEGVLSDIRTQCFVEDVFQSDGARAVMQYVSDKYGTLLEWYAALLTAAGNKIGLEGNGNVEILDLRIDPAKLEQTIDYKRYFPGYHMNKKNWYTICLNGSVEDKELFERIDISYELAKKK